MVKMFIGGDVLNYHSQQYMLDDEMKQTISEADYSICNFEAPIESDGIPMKKAGPVVMQHSKTIEILKDAGFDLLLLGNNHIYDYGYEGLKSTLEEARKRKLETIGAALSFEEGYKPLIKTINGIIFGFINASEAQFGVLKSSENNEGYAWINHPKIDQIVRDTKNKVDYLLFFAHAGLENYDIPLIEWRYRYRWLCDLGVDIIIGSHPHVPQGYEDYNGSTIFYSLGNFYFSYNNQETTHGYSLTIEFNPNEPYKIEILYHQLQDGLLVKESETESPISFDVLNGKITKEYYENHIALVYENAFDEICLPYLASALNTSLDSDSIVVKIKKLIKKMVFRRRNEESRMLLLLHMVKNETYRFIIERVIEERYGN